MTATPFRKRRRTLITGCVSLVAIAVATLAIVGYVWGPSAAIVFTGSPHYPFPPTPQKYAKDVVRAPGLAGIYASSDEFASARKDALEQVKGASSYEDTYGPLREVVRQPAASTRTSFRPGPSQTRVQLRRRRRSFRAATLRSPLCRRCRATTTPRAMPTG